MFTVPQTDARRALRGQLGVRCRQGCHIPARTLLGPYAAYVCTQKEQEVRKYEPPPGSGDNDSGGGVSDDGVGKEAAVRRAEEERKEPALRGIRRLEEESQHQQFETTFESTKGTAVDGVKLLVDAYGYGGFAAAVNDPTIDPFTSMCERMAEPNVALVEVLVYGKGGGRTYCTVHSQRVECSRATVTRRACI
jgi:hypothetical protein